MKVSINSNEVGAKLCSKIVSDLSIFRVRHAEGDVTERSRYENS